MDFSYQFTRKEYEKTVADLLYQRRRSPLSVLVFLLMTVGQIAFTVYCLFRFHLTGSHRSILILLSAAIAITQLVYWFTIPQRARSQTEQAIRKGTISPDFWKPQHLSLHDDLLRIKSGKADLRYDCAYFQKDQIVGNTLLLTFTKDKTSHQIMIPCSAFSSSEEQNRFLDMIRSSKADSILAGINQDCAIRPEDADFSVEYRYTLEAFSRDQIRAVRAAYTSRVSWTLSTIARVVAAVFLIWHLVHGSYSSVPMTVLVVVILLFLLYPFLISFTPLCRFLVRRYSASLFSGLNQVRCSLDVAEHKLYYIGDTFDNIIDVSQITDLVRLKDLTIIYLKDNTSITIPYASDSSIDMQRLCVYLQTAADQNWSARRGKDLLR